MNVTISGFYDEISGKLDDQLAELKKLNEHYMCPRNIDGKNISDYTAEEFIANIKPRLDEAGVKFSSIGSPIGKIDIDDENGYERQKKQLAELIKIAKEMDCKYIRVFSFFYGDRKPSSITEKVIKKFSGFLEIAKGSGVKLLHENEKKIYGDAPERVLNLYEALKCDELGLCFDASNYVQCDVDPKAAFDTLKEYVEYYHIKDCSAYKVEVPVGAGKGCYDYIIGELKKRNYNGFMTLEPHTFKYAMMKPAVYFIPFMPLLLSNFYCAFRQIDKYQKVSWFKCASRREVFEWQYNNLKKFLGE